MKPPVAPIHALEAIMPSEKTISVAADCIVVPPKCSNVISGNKAEMGLNSTENAKPIHSMANKPAWRLSSR